MLKDLINHDVVRAEPDATVMEVARLMAERDVGSVLVLSNERPRGIITDRDIVVRCLAKNLDPSVTIENLLTESLVTCRENDGVFECIQKMHDARIRRMPVVDADGKAIGIISFGDLLAVLSQEFAALTSTTTHAEAAGDLRHAS